MENVHDVLGNFTMLMLVVHVLVSNLIEGENLVKAMLTERKKKSEILG